MHPVTEKYFSLSKDQQKFVQINLCEKAFEVWLTYVKKNKFTSYRESVCGTLQDLDFTLPIDAIQSVKTGSDRSNIKERYLEPIAAIQDSDLIFPDEIELAYYAVYNLYNFYLTNKLDDSWLIINQSLSALGEDQAIINLETEVKNVAQHVSAP